MAPIGSVLKNGIIFLILSAPFIYVGSLILFSAFQNIFYAEALGGFKALNDSATSQDTINLINSSYDAFRNLLFLGLFIIIGGPGLIYLKSLSDTVEDGMIEF